MLSMRPAGSREPLYSPERDLGRFLIEVYDHYVLGAFAESRNTAWLDQAGPPASSAERQDAARKLFDALLLFRDPEVGSAEEGLRAAGFWECSASARRDVAAMLGMVLANKFYGDVRSAMGYPDARMDKLFLATPMMREAIEAGMEALGIDETVRRGKGR